MLMMLALGEALPQAAGGAADAHDAGLHAGEVLLQAAGGAADAHDAGFHAGGSTTAGCRRGG